MNKNEFLIELEDVLQKEQSCSPSDVLSEYEEWDSLSKMAVMAFFDKNFGIKISLPEIKNFVTVNDLIVRAGIES